MKKMYPIFLIVIILFTNCKKIEGPEGKISLIDLTTESSGINCYSGGFKVTTGIDLNGNSLLDENEIQNTKYICNGVDGNSSLISAVTEPSGIICPNGGYKITSGIDVNRNGILDVTEIQTTKYLCNGLDGGYDQQIRLSFGENYLMTSATTWAIDNNQNEHLLKFNKNNYLNSDSIIVGFRLATTNSNTKCFGELYNVTDGTSIANSQLESIVTNTEFLNYKFSKNIYNDLPDHEVTLALRIKSETNGTSVIGGFPSYIYIYRKK